MIKRRRLHIISTFSMIKRQRLHIFSIVSILRDRDSTFLVIPYRQRIISFSAEELLRDNKYPPPLMPHLWEFLYGLSIHCHLFANYCLQSHVLYMLCIMCALCWVPWVARILLGGCPLVGTSVIFVTVGYCMWTCKSFKEGVMWQSGVYLVMCNTALS